MKTSKLNMFKVLSVAITTFLLSSTVLHAGNKSASQVQSFEENSEYSMTIVEKSKALRKSIKLDRSIAGMSSQDIKWAAEFDRMMADTKTDYLKVALQITD